MAFVNSTAASLFRCRLTSLPNKSPRTVARRARTSHKVFCATNLDLLTYATVPIPGQKTGTSGLRRKTRELLETPTFLPNWIQALFDALGGPYVLDGRILILGGDGRFYNRAAAQLIIRMAAANGIGHVVVGAGCIMTTPAVSALIPKLGAVGGLIMTASHNPAGLDGDWGIKYNTENGAPALEALTDSIYMRTQKINEYQLADLGGDVNLEDPGTTIFDGGSFIVEVIDPVEDYLATLETVFNFDAIRALITRPDFTMLFDAMHASTGGYARRILVDELGAPAESILNGIPLEDFGGDHPDPNLTYAAELVRRLDPDNCSDAPSFGAASDGDGDRNMILGRGVFVNPADSVAVIAAHAVNAIPYFQDRGLKGLARSMPTSSALDRVAEHLGIPLFETPTGWKYFTNLMDAGMLSICGEESFGTSSDHIREKDGLWAVLAWLSILAHENLLTPIGSLVSVRDILEEHWLQFGRTFAMRHDYESVASDDGDAVMEHLRSAIADRTLWPATVERMDEFEYIDPIDCSVASRQGIRIYTTNGGRIVFRLSGTGSAGATIRMYFELYEGPSDTVTTRDPKEVFVHLVELAVEFGRVKELTGREFPTVVT
jgi:phosphoglucomutase